MSENHFRSHFWPFQINTDFFFKFYKMAASGHFGCPKITFDLISGHFRSIRNFFFFGNRPFWISEFHFRSQFWPFQIDTEFIFFQRPFWMSENHIGSHFWPFQIDRPFWMSEIHFRWHFWPFLAIVRNSLWITFLAILDQYRFFIF